jgi:hypothetical protein
MIMSRIVVSNVLKRSRQNVLSSIVLSSSMATVTQSPSPTTSGTIHPTCCLVSQRSFGSEKGYYKTRRKEKKVDPHAVLGVSPDEKYAAVRKSFIRIAMKHHPDTAEKASTPEQEEENRETFMAARSAFEMLTECPTEGIAILRSESELSVDEDVDVWFKEETGYDMPFMDLQTMKEVAEMTEKVGGGLDRDGGMWTLARMVTENMKSGGDGKDVLRLESGDVRDRSINGILRRRRRR